MLPCDDLDQLLTVELFEGNDYLWYKPESSLHDFTEAFGPTEKRLGVLVKQTWEKEFVLEAEPLDGSLKLCGLWQNTEGKAFQSSIWINDRELHSGLLHLPVVKAGWPSVYLNVPAGYLKKGINHISLAIDGAPLLINQFCLFIRPSRAKVFDVLHAPRVVTKDRPFWVTLLLYQQVNSIKVDCHGPIEYIPESEQFTPGEIDVFFRPTGKAGDCGIIITCDGQKSSVDLPPVLDIPTGLPCYVGTDSDDHPHDDTGMMDEIILHLFRSETGNLVALRPQIGRNCVYPPTESLYSAWINLCRKYNAVYMATALYGCASNFPDAVEREMAADPNFVCHRLHEPYFMTHDAWSSDAFKTASDYSSASDALIGMLKDTVDFYHKKGMKIAAGEASWLATYDGEAGFDIINAEPVTSIAPIFSTVRGAMRGRPNMLLGCHVAIEWYLGYPYNDLKTKRAYLLMLQAFAYGATFIYTENSLFFTNSYQRHDPEDKFTTDNRAAMRNIYDIARLQPRFGEPCAELGVIYGNLESILWYHDDVLPEMEDGSEWMKCAFNKWQDQTSRPAWRALDAWLVPVEIEKYDGNKSILKWFSGNPYGNVDIVSATQDIDIISTYKVLALLGWNTMTENVLEKLSTYVLSGGILFINGYHFDRRTMPVGEYDIDTTDASELLGLSVRAPGEIVADVVYNGNTYHCSQDRLCKLDINDAEVIVSDAQSSPILLRHKYGNGTVYFCNFWDHPSTAASVDLLKAFMAHLGQKCKSSFGVEDGYGISCSHWYDPESNIRRLYLINTNWQKSRTSRSFILRLWDKAFPLTIGQHDISIVTERNGVAVAIDNPCIFISDISIDSSECRVTMTGNGRYTMTVFFSDAVDGHPAVPKRARGCTTICGYVSGRSEITICRDLQASPY